MTSAHEAIDCIQTPEHPGWGRCSTVGVEALEGEQREDDFGREGSPGLQSLR